MTREKVYTGVHSPENSIRWWTVLIHSNLHSDWTIGKLYKSITATKLCWIILQCLGLQAPSFLSDSRLDWRLQEGYMPLPHYPNLCRLLHLILLLLWAWKTSCSLLELKKDTVTMESQENTSDLSHMVSNCSQPSFILLVLKFLDFFV